MSFDGKGRRVVEARVLEQWFRAQLQADPVHQIRMRKLRMAEGENDG